MSFLSLLFPANKREHHNLTAPQLSSLIKKIQPRELEGEVVTEGDPNHLHHFELGTWDCQRLGKSFVDADKDPGTEIAFPMATFRDLFVCNCGREIVRSTRALI